MKDFFAQPWTIYGNGSTIEVTGQNKPYMEIRQQMYENIIDEPIFVRKKYVESFEKELREREKRLNQGKKPK